MCYVQFSTYVRQARVFAPLVASNHDGFELSELHQPNMIRLTRVNEVEEMENFDGMVSVELQDTIQRADDVAAHILIEKQPDHALGPRR